LNIEYITKIAYEKMGKSKAQITREKGFIYYHGLRTAKLALTLRKYIFPEITQYDDVIFVGALFHDIGKGVEPHEETGQVLVKHILKEYCLEEELGMSSDIVRFHRDRKTHNDYPIWVQLVQDADILEHQGTTEVWLNVAYSLYEEQSYDRAIEWWLKDEKSLAGRIKQRNKLNFDFSKKIWDEKILFVDSFIRRLEEESEGTIYV
jgi:uncharacterized protein